LHINLGIGDYSVQSQARTELLVAPRPGAVLHVVDMRGEYGAGIPELIRSRRGRKPCSLCGLIKRHIMNRMARDGGYAAVATGHNLDDEGAVLLQNALRWSVSYLARQGPALPEAPGLARRVKPLCRLREREMAAYALVRGIDYIQDECPHAEWATTLFYKGILDQLEARSRGAKEMFYLSFLDARAQHDLFRSEREQLEMHTCSQCGQATTALGRCAFCRLWAAGSEPGRQGDVDGGGIAGQR